MKLFIDTANIAEIREAASWGIIQGVTTNPTLVSKEGRPFRELVEEICSIVNGPISVEVTATDADGMVEEGREIAKWHKNIVLKIPMGVEGIKAVKRLSQEGIKTNVTLIFSPNQALLAAEAGATFASIFVGRLDDIGHDGMEVVEKSLRIYKNYDFSTEILVASVRHPIHVLRAAEIGAPIATVPYKVLELMFKHPLTDIGLERFLSDWEKMKAIESQR
ncbi:fructose-6-phosphate aldolase [bacterium]|nr:fructose-6-phosphate aldolase [bacterium]